MSYSLESIYLELANSCLHIKFSEVLEFKIKQAYFAFFVLHEKDQI